MADYKVQVERFYNVLWNTHDLEAIPSVLHPNFRFRGSLGETKMGHEGFAEYVNKVHLALGDYRCTIEELIAEESKVFAKMIFAGRHQRKLMGYEPTQEVVSWSGCALFTFTDGLIDDLWVLGDLKSLEDQLKENAGNAHKVTVPPTPDLPEEIEIMAGVSQVQSGDLARVVEVWEASVRATHHFLTESDIEFFKPLVRQLVSETELNCVREKDGRIVGFLGVADDKIEMLFVDPKWFRHGVGQRLVDYAIQTFGTTKVDVNEQNGGAVKFYQHLDFEQYDRSELDSTGKPFPILHLRLRDQP